MQLQLIRSATLVITYGGYHMLVDPDFAPQHARPSFTGTSPNPMVDLPLPVPAILAGLDLVIVSHLHQDHFDTVAAEALPKDLPVICQPGDEYHLRAQGFANVTPVEDVLEWNGIRITRTQGEHGQGAVLALMGQVSGFMFEVANEPSLYCAGDTVLSESVRQTLSHHNPEVIVTHSCGAVWQDFGLIVMDAAQTIAVFQLVPQSMVVAVHMDAFDHATVSRAQLREAARAAGISDRQLSIPIDGQMLSFSSK